MLRVGLFCSGSGEYLRKLVNAQNECTLTDAMVVCTVCDVLEAEVVKTAQSLGVKCDVVCKDDFADSMQWELALAREIATNSIDLVVLAGFETQLSDEFIKQFEGRIVKLQPSLVPSFCDEGMFGINVHKAVLARGVKVTGATVYYLTQNVAEGEIVAQKAVEVLRGDTPQVLQKRVMEKGELMILTRAVQLIAEDAALSAAVQGTTCMRRNPGATDAMF